MTQLNTDRNAAILWARQLLARTDWCIFDTETTGLRGAEIVQIGLLAPSGQVLMNTLVKPAFPIPAEATAIHHITNEDCAGAPQLSDLLPRMGMLMHGNEVVVYNKGFDQGILHGCLRRRKDDRLADNWIAASRWTCAMERYSQFVGEWNDYHGNYRWQKLPGAGHDAIGDCIATLKVIQAMAEAEP